MRFLGLLAGLMLSGLAVAQQSLSVAEVLEGFLKVTEQQCKDGAVRLEQNRATMELALQLTMDDGLNTLCGCLPKRLREALAKLPAEELARNVQSQEELLAVVRPRALDSCLAAQMRRPYEYRCEDRFNPGDGVDVPRYCACMKTTARAIPEREATDIGVAAADYIPRAAEARKKGAPVPPPPASLQRMQDADAQCKASSKGAAPQG
jgi:hypothetical protein